LFIPFDKLAIFGESWEKMKEKIDFVAAGQDDSVYVAQDTNCIFALRDSNWVSVDGTTLFVSFAIIARNFN
jgi:hypothetical protein